MRSRSDAQAYPFFPLLLLGALALGFVVMPARVPREQPYATVIVLGAAQYSGKPSPAFQRRLDHALGLYRAGGIKRIVVTGGQAPGDQTTEGEVGMHYLQTLGVPASALFAETRSRTTIANLRNTRLYFPEERAVTLVTDPAHAARALALAKALGFEANVSPSQLKYRPSWQYVARERLAFLAYALIGIRS